MSESKRILNSSLKTNLLDYFTRISVDYVLRQFQINPSFNDLQCLYVCMIGCIAILVAELLCAQNYLYIWNTSIKIPLA